MRISDKFNISASKVGQATILPIVFSLGGCVTGTPHKEPHLSYKQNPLVELNLEERHINKRLYPLIHEKDLRTPVLLSNRKYDAVGQIISSDGICTGTISEVFGFKALEGKALISTAAHCAVDEYDEPKDEIFFVGTYQGEDRVEVYRTQVEDVWVTSYNDFALLTIPKSSIPDAVKPAILYPMDSIEYHGNDKFILNSSGYSGDRHGLTTHDECEAVTMEQGYIETKCESYNGASGGPVSLNLDKENHLKVVAVVSYQAETYSEFENISQGESSFEAVADPIILEVVPFLKQKAYCGTVVNGKGAVYNPFGYDDKGLIPQGTDINITYAHGDIMESVYLSIQDHEWVYVSELKKDEPVSGRARVKDIQFTPCG